MWIEGAYHRRIHGGLPDNQTPISMWRDELHHVRSLLPHMVQQIDDLFYHREERLVRKNGTISWNGNFYEVDHKLVGDKVTLVFDPHTNKTIRIETDLGEYLGTVTPLDLDANLNRSRQRPHAACAKTKIQQEYAIENSYKDYEKQSHIPDNYAPVEEDV